MKCQLCKNNEVIYSGVDAFMLGVPTETVCYECASIYARNIQQSEKVGA